MKQHLFKHLRTHIFCGRFLVIANSGSFKNYYGYCQQNAQALVFFSCKLTSKNNKSLTD